MIFFFILFFIFIICCGVISTQFEILVILYRFGIFGGHHDFSMAARNDWLKLQNYYDVA
jgi:hypothetical protein